MNEINKILNDESQNDKQLIKELSVYIKNHRDKGLPINKKFFMDIINITLRNSEVDFNDIYFDDNNEYDSEAVWSSSTLTFDYFITIILNYAVYYKKNWFAPQGLKGDKRAIVYFESISTIIHEITHARQDYVMEHFNNNIYDSCNSLINDYFDDYLKHYDTILIERYANLRGYVMAYKVLAYIYPLKYITPFRKIILALLKEGYKINNQGNIKSISSNIEIHEDTIIISPLDSYNQVMKEISCDNITVESNDNMTLYDKLYLGLPISKEECIKLNKVIKDILKYVPLNNDQSDVKRLINRM